MKTGLEPVMQTGFASYWLIEARNSLNVILFMLFFFLMKIKVPTLLNFYDY